MKISFSDFQKVTKKTENKRLKKKRKEVERKDKPEAQMVELYWTNDEKPPMQNLRHKIDERKYHRRLGQLKQPRQNRYKTTGGFFAKEKERYSCK